MQRLLDEPRIAGADEFKELFDEQACLDEMFKCLLQPDMFLGESDNWWEKRVLIRAGEEYCFYMEKAHGISVECVDC